MDKPILEQLMEKCAEKLLDKIKSGQATAADYANAIRLLKDNGIKADPTYKPLQELAEDTPFSEDDFKRMMED